MRRSVEVTIALVAVLLVGAAASTVMADEIIYWEQFDGGSGNLDGTAPNVRPGSEVWDAQGAVWLENGDVTSAHGHSGAWLPFDVDNYLTGANDVFRLTPPHATTPSDDWMTVGFSKSNSHNHFNAIDSYGTMLRRGDSNGATSWLGKRTNGGEGAGDMGPGDLTVSITLDASHANSANWTIAFEASTASTNYTRAAATVADGDFGDIAYIGFTRLHPCIGQLKNLKLERVIPPSGTVVLIK